MPELEPEPPESHGGSLADVWAEYKATGSSELRDQLILQYTPLVRYVAGRLAGGLPPTIERADLVSYGVFGLIDAIARFDPAREIKFETYALVRIRGAIFDELRATDWIPRSVRSKAKEVEAVQSRFETQLHRAPTETELAAELGVDVGTLRRTLAEVSYASVLALDDALGATLGDGTERISLAEILSDQRAEIPGSAIDAAETRASLVRAIKRLPTRERIVVTLYYFENLTLSEIAQVLGVTEGRISQIHTHAVTGLRMRLGPIAD